MLAMSTSWMSSPEKGMSYWLNEVRNLGVSAVELSYKIDHQQLEEVEGILKDLGIQVTSIHNFCPTPDDEPTDRHPSNYYRLSSLEEHERAQAVKWTKIAVDTARRVGADVVVIHAGVVAVEDERNAFLFDLFEAGKKHTNQFALERSRILSLRKKSRSPYLEALQKSLNDVMSYACQKEIRIGLETRYYPLEMPNFEEIGLFLKKYAHQGMGYWHDVGHAEINSRLGITPHTDFLETYKEHLIGVHLHGIKGRRDHLAPFEGDMELEDYMTFFGSDVIRVIESKPFASPSLIKEAITKLR